MRDRISRDRGRKEKLIGKRIIMLLSLPWRLLGRRGAVGWLGCWRRSWCCTAIPTLKSLKWYGMD